MISPIQRLCRQVANGCRRRSGPSSSDGRRFAGQGPAGQLPRSSLPAWREAGARGALICNINVVESAGAGPFGGHGKTSKEQRHIGANPSHPKEAAGELYDYIRPLATIEPTAIWFGLPVDVSLAFNDRDGLQARAEKEAHANRPQRIASCRWSTG